MTAELMAAVSRGPYGGTLFELARVPAPDPAGRVMQPAPELALTDAQTLWEPRSSDAAGPPSAKR